MARRRKPTDDEIRQHKLEMLDRQVNPTGEGEDPAIAAVLSEQFVHAPDLDAVQVALMLQQILEGQKSLLGKYEENSLEIAKLKEMMANTDKQLEARMSAQQKEIQEVLDRAEKLKLKGDKKDKLIAKASQEYTKAVQNARAKNASDHLKFDQQLAHMKKETVISPGEFVIVRQGQSLIPQLIPEVIRIKHRTWVLPPNIPVEVPFAVAEQLRNKRAGQAETQKRAELLSKHLEQSKLAAEWNKVEGSSESLPLA